MNRPREILIATRNAHKTHEFALMLGADYVVHDLSTAGFDANIEETGQTFEDNATLKALQISRMSGGIVLADDSGLEVDVLGGAPGVHSARFAGVGATDARNRAKLMAQLVEVCGVEGARAGSPARFRCVLVVASQGDVLSVAHGVVEGRVIAEERGAGGFGYDPLFIPQGETRTFAELPESVKNRLSHRARAFVRTKTVVDNLFR